MFPKIAVVLGAHTELGKRVLSLLLRHPLIEKVHALAEIDPRDDISLRHRDQPKLALHLDPLDHLEETVARYIPECDLAFCVSGCGKKDMAVMGAYQYHKTNLDIPRRFIHEMFNLGVERIALLSHASASSKARASEFIRIKRQLEKIVRELQAEARQYAPDITVFKVPLMLTNMKDASGMRGSSITKRDKAKQTAAYKLELGPSHAVHVRDVAKAMVADTFYKLDMAERSSNIEPVFRRRDIRYAEMDGRSIVELAQQSRKMLRETIEKYRRQLEYEDRISGYAQQNMGSESIANSGGYDEDQSRPSDQQSEPMVGRIVENGSNESYMWGTPPPENLTCTEEGQPDSFVSDPSLDEQEREKNIFSPTANPGLISPHPSPQPQHFSPQPQRFSSQPQRFSPQPQRFEEEESVALEGSGSFHLPESQHSSRAQTTSVEALSQQLGRRLTVIRDNEYLPGAQPHPLQSFDGEHYTRSQNQHYSPESGSGLSIGAERQYDDDYEGMAGDYVEETPHMNRQFRSSTNSLESPPSWLNAEIQHHSPVRRPDVESDGYGTPLQRYSSASYDRSVSHSRRRPRSSADRYPDFYRRSEFLQGRSADRDGIRSERTESRRSSLITRVTELAERVIAATDRPSMRRDSYTQGEAFRRRDAIAEDESVEPVLRGNGDMRPVGETSI